MCRNAIIHHRDGSATVCRCQDDLHEAMPRGVWFFPPAGEPDLEGDGFDPDACLCPVDLDRTARENGYRVSRYAPDGTEDPFDDHLYLDCCWRALYGLCANPDQSQGYCDPARQGTPLPRCPGYAAKPTPSERVAGPTPAGLLSAACAAASAIVVWEALSPMLEYLEQQDDLPVGYRKAIRGYWVGKYDFDGLRERVEAIDGAAAFIRHCGAYGEHLGEPAPL